MKRTFAKNRPIFLYFGTFLAVTATILFCVFPLAKAVLFLSGLALSYWLGLVSLSWILKKELKKIRIDVETTNGALQNMQNKDNLTQRIDLSEGKRLESKANNFCTLGLDSELSTLEDSIIALEKDVKSLKERYELVTTNIAASLLIRDVSGHVEFCSPYTQVLTGYSPEDIYIHPGDFFETIVLDEDLERYRRATKVSELGEDILVRYRATHQSGLKLWLETRMVPIADRFGEVRAILAVTIDVTDTLSYQKQIEERNQDVSDFAYMVSHDLKAPIFTIKGMASALLEDYGESLGEDGKELIEFILEGGDRLEKLVASVIEYSSVTTRDSQNTEVDLNEAVRSVLKDLGERVREKDATVSVEGELPVVNGDQIRVYQVFSNLIGNALKYSSAERRPVVRVRSYWNGDDSYVIDVIDNGLGIPEEKVPDVFRPYHRAHGAEIEGSGVGLACVKKIVDQMGGTVSVSSTLGEGSVFRVILPGALPKPQEIPNDLARLF